MPVDISERLSEIIPILSFLRVLMSDQQKPGLSSGLFYASRKLISFCHSSGMVLVMFSLKSVLEGANTVWYLCREAEVVAGPFDSKQSAESHAIEIARANPDNAQVIFELLINATPLSVKEFLEAQLPNRSQSPEYSALKPYLVEMMHMLTMGGLAVIDHPITENSMIRRITDTGYEAYQLHLRSRALKRL